MSALRGLRVVELTWFIAGPLVGRWLADQGAEVIKIESRLRSDPARTITPSKPGVRAGERNLDQAVWHTLFNTSVRSIALNLGDPRGLDLLKQLIGKADILLENFAPGTMERWNLGWEDVRRTYPGVIMVRMPLVGSEGPRAGLSGGGNHLTALAGLQQITGFPGGPPSAIGPRGIYPDYGPNPLHATIAILAALHYRRRTGQGQLIEIPQLESVVAVNGPSLLDYSANRRITGRTGNRTSSGAPEDAIRCQAEGGRERWCAIAVETDAQWHALVTALGSPDWATDPALATFAGRKAHEDAILAHLEAWSRARPVVAVVEQLQQYGVPAALVASGPDLLADPQLAHRDHYQYRPHPELPDLPLNRLGYRLEQADPGPIAAAPVLGEHTDAVLREVLGLPSSAIETLRSAGVLE